MHIRRLSYPVRYGYGMPSLLGLDDHLHMSLTTSALISLTSLVNGLLSSLRLAKRSALAVSTPKGPSRAQENMEFACRSPGTTSADLHVFSWEPNTG
jgi:hypothetical protein